MELEKGKIVRIIDGKAIVQMETGSHCKTCAAKHACTTLSGDTVRQIEIPVVDDIKVGDNIMLGYKPQNRILSAFLVFIIPILMLITGYFIGQHIFGTEGMAILTGFAGLIFAFILIWGLNKILLKENKFLPTILKVNN